MNCEGSIIMIKNIKLVIPDDLLGEMEVHDVLVWTA